MSRKLAIVGTLVAASGVAFFGGRLSAHGGIQPDAQMQMPESMMLAPEHEALKQMVGNWEGTVRFKMGDTWDSSDSKASRRLAMDGRFVIEEVRGTMPDGEFHGMGIVGYNTIDKRYESVWIENLATHVSMATGTFDKASKRFTFEGDMIDPMTGVKARTIMSVDVSDPNKEVFKGHAIRPDGSKDLIFEGTFSRVP